MASKIILNGTFRPRKMCVYILSFLSIISFSICSKEKVKPINQLVIFPLLFALARCILFRNRLQYSLQISLSFAQYSLIYLNSHIAVFLRKFMTLHISIQKCEALLKKCEFKLMRFNV